MALYVTLLVVAAIVVGSVCLYGMQSRRRAASDEAAEAPPSDMDLSVLADAGTLVSVGVDGIGAVYGDDSSSSD